MKPQKFIQNLKCDCYQPVNYCNCPLKIVGSDKFIENVNDVAAAVVEVMNLCGIDLNKANASLDVIIYYLLHFEEIHHRIDSIPKKRLAKEGLINDLTRKCNMNRMETQMTYSIVKRVFKAFYYGSDEGGVPNPLLSRQLTHSPACLWVHAACRTAQIYAAYEGIFYACQKDFESKIKLIYKQLYDRLESRPLMDDSHECICMKCLKRITAETLRTVTVTTKMHGLENPYEAMYKKDLEESMKMQAFIKEQTVEAYVKESKAKQTQCSCAPLKLSENDQAYRTIAESVKTDCSQGPFVCHWLSISKEEYEADDATLHIQLPEEVPCSPCYDLDSECERECRCVCEKCKCATDDDYFCSMEGSFENDMEEIEMDNELEYDYEDIEQTSPHELEKKITRTIISSAKCSTNEPKPYISKCSTKVEDVPEQKENEDVSTQETIAEKPKDEEQK